MCVFLSVCTVFLSVCICVFLSVSLFVANGLNPPPNVFLTSHIPYPLSLPPYIPKSICLFVRVSCSLSVCLFFWFIICLSCSLSVCLFVTNHLPPIRHHSIPLLQNPLLHLPPRSLFALSTCSPQTLPLLFCSISWQLYSC